MLLYAVRGAVLDLRVEVLDGFGQDTYHSVDHLREEAGRIVAFGLTAAQQPIFALLLSVAIIGPEVHRAAALAEEDASQGIDHLSFFHRWGPGAYFLHSIP